MYIQRNIHQKIKEHLKRKEYTIITGPRQCGKTSLVQALYTELQDDNKTVSYITFEDREILSAVNSHPEEVFSFAIRPKKNLNKDEKQINPAFLFIDEIQYADNPSNFLKYLYDIYGTNLKIIATGSSAFYIDNKFKDSLAGRKRIFDLKTLSFDEWLTFKGSADLYQELLRIRKQEDYISSANRELIEYFNEYIVFGGYPAVALEQNIEEKILILKELKNSFLKKDIDESGISHPDKFYTLIAILASQTGNLVNRNELGNTIGVDNKTIDKYLYVLQNCFHIDLIQPFYSNIRKELTKMPKVYFKDSGMRNIALNRFFDFKDREDQGQLIENYVFNRLTELYDKDSVKYWRTADKKEIDFIVTTSFRNGMAYEVKIKNQRLKKTTLKIFEDNYPGYSVQIISYLRKDGGKWVLKL